MKKYLSLLLTGLLLFCTGCSSSPDVASIEDAPQPTDYTVAADTFDPSQYQQIGTIESTADFEKIYHNLEELTQNADNIVYGTVTATQNFDESGVGMTLYTFSISASYLGDLQSGGQISVLADGGYVRMCQYIHVFGSGHFENLTPEEIQTSVVYNQPAMGAPAPEVGDSYMLFLSKPIQDEEPFPNGAYVELGAFMGRYQQVNGQLTRYIPENEPNFYQTGEISTFSIEDDSYTLEEMEQYLGQLLAE